MRLEYLEDRCHPAVSWEVLPDTVGQRVLMADTDHGTYPVLIGAGEPSSVSPDLTESRLEQIAQIPLWLYLKAPVVVTFGLPITAAPDLATEAGDIIRTPGYPPRPVGNIPAQEVWSSELHQPHGVAEIGWPQAEPQKINGPLYEAGHGLGLLAGSVDSAGNVRSVSYSAAWLAVWKNDTADGTIARVGGYDGPFLEGNAGEWFADSWYIEQTTGQAPSVDGGAFLAQLLLNRSADV